MSPSGRADISVQAKPFGADCVLPSVSLRKLLVPFFALTTVIAGGLAWRQHEAYLDLQASFEKKLDQERAALLQRITDAERRQHELEDDLAARMASSGDPLAAMPEARPATPAVANRPPDRGQRGEGGRRAGTSINELMTKNPEFARLVSMQQKAQLDERYSGLFKSLKLNGADLDKLKGLLAEKQNTYRDVAQAAREKGLNQREHADDIRKLVDQANAEIDQSIKSTLGESVYDQYKHYEQTAVQRGLVEQLDRRLSYLGGGLQDQQSQQLVNILAANPVPRPTTGTTNGNQAAGGRVGGGGFGGGENWGGAGRAISDAAVQQAATVLNPQQLAALQQLQAEQKAQRQIRDMFRQATQPQSKTATTTPPAK